jgi:6-phosphogluconolactonase (cycloisomerase 2 family)
MRVVALGLALAVLAARPAGAGTILYATAATPGRIDGFCVRGNGSLAPAPKVQAATTGTQPRRLLVGDGVLYVAEFDRVEAFLIGPRGLLSHHGRTKIEPSMDPRDLKLSPDGRTLYVPQRSQFRIVAYPLGEDGSLDKEAGFTSCIQGEFGEGYQDLLVQDSLLYVTGSFDSGRVEVFAIDPNGQLPATPEECRPGTAEDERPAATAPLSYRNRLFRPKSFLVAGDMLYVEERGRKQITAFKLGGFSKEDFSCEAPPGNFCPLAARGKKGKTKPQPVASRTAGQVNYEGLVLDRTGTTLLGAQFFRGRIDAYRLRKDGRLRKRPSRSSREDLRMSPVRMAVSEDNVLYVAAGVLDRVAAYRLRASDGLLTSATPFNETDTLPNSFPNDVALAVLSDGCE